MAPYPSPEGTTIHAIGNRVSGAPYARDWLGRVWTLKPTTAAEDAAAGFEAWVPPINNYVNVYHDDYRNNLIGSSVSPPEWLKIANGEAYISVSGHVQKLSGYNANNAPLPALAPHAGAIVPDNSTRFYPVDMFTARQSPEGAVTFIHGGQVRGAPYLVDASGNTYQLDPSVSPAAVLVNGNPANLGGADSPAELLIMSGGTVHLDIGSGHIQELRNGTTYNASLARFNYAAVAAAGLTVVDPGTAAAASPAPPLPPAPPPPPAPDPMALPPLPTIMPGSSGIVWNCGAPGQPTLAEALVTAADGDTVKAAPGVYTTGLPTDKIRKSVLLDLTGVTLDFSGIPVTSLAGGGQGGLVPTRPFRLVNGMIMGVGLTDTGASNCAGVRHDTGCGYVWIDGTTFRNNQAGIGGAGVGRTKYVLRDVTLDNNGLAGAGRGFTHNIYLGSDVDLEMTNVTSINPAGGHAVKHRGPVMIWNGGRADATDAAIIERAEGTFGEDQISGVTLTKPAGSPNHAVISMGVDGLGQGGAKMKLTGCTIAANCDNPFYQGGGKLTLDHCTLTGNPIDPTAMTVVKV